MPSQPTQEQGVLFEEVGWDDGEQSSWLVLVARLVDTQHTHTYTEIHACTRTFAAQRSMQHSSNNTGIFTVDA